MYHSRGCLSQQSMLCNFPCSLPTLSEAMWATPSFQFGLKLCHSWRTVNQKSQTNILCRTFSFVSTMHSVFPFYVCYLNQKDIESWHTQQGRFGIFNGSLWEVFVLSFFHVLKKKLNASARMKSSLLSKWKTAEWGDVCSSLGPE